MVNSGKEWDFMDNLIYPFVVKVEYDEEIDDEKYFNFPYFEDAEKKFFECRNIYNCKIEFYEQSENQRIKTFATYYAN
jgi:hypothetical protein